MGNPGMCYNTNILNIVICFGVIIWFVVFSLLVLLRLDKIIKLLEKK